MLIGLDGAGSKAPDLSDGVSGSQAPLLHQVTGQHGASAAKAQGTVHRHRLSPGVGLVDDLHEAVDLLWARRAEVWDAQSVQDENTKALERFRNLTKR